MLYEICPCACAYFARCIQYYPTKITMQSFDQPESVRIMANVSVYCTVVPFKFLSALRSELRHLKALKEIIGKSGFFVTLTNMGKNTHSPMASAVNCSHIKWSRISNNIITARTCYFFHICVLFPFVFVRVSTVSLVSLNTIIPTILAYDDMVARH